MAIELNKIHTNLRFVIITVKNCLHMAIELNKIHTNLQFVIITVKNYFHKCLLNYIRRLFPQNENYFLPSTAIRSGSRVFAASKKELFVVIAYSESK